MFSAHGGRLFRGGRCLVALKIENAVASMDKTIKLHAKLIPRRNIFAILTLTLTFCGWSVDDLSHIKSGHTRSFCCSFSVNASRFSSSCSSLNVGLRIMVSAVRGGAPGDFIALFNGVFGVGGGKYFRSVSSISTDWT